MGVKPVPPTFKLYRIVDTKTGKCLLNSSPVYTCKKPDNINEKRISEHVVWTNQGNFFRTTKTVKKHLRNISYFFEWKEPSGLFNGYWMRTDERIQSRVNRYKIECYEVLQLSKVDISAEDLLKREKIQEEV